MSPPPCHPPAPPELMDEVLGEIFLRIPPEEPAHLFRAAQVCKPWHRVLSDPAFRRGYRERHRRPPLLGFFHNAYGNGPIARFVPTAASPCSSPPVLNCRDWCALDSRHGRVLIYRFAPSGLVVWDPITGNQHHLPLPPYPHREYTAAVLCATANCNHLDCREGPFIVVFVGSNDEELNTWVSMYSSQTCVWSAMATADFSTSSYMDQYSYVETKPSVLIGDTLYFTLESAKSILKYDLIEQGLLIIDAPELNEQMGIVVVTEDGGLGFAGIEDNKLCIWSWLEGDGNSAPAGWTVHRVIKLESLLPVGDLSISPEVVGFAEGTDIVFLHTNAGVFTFEIKSEKIRKVSSKRGAYYCVLPYLSFCTPV